VLVVLAYSDSWHQVLSIELAVHLKKLGHEVSFVDISSAGESILRLIQKMRIKTYRARRGYKKVLVANQIPLSEIRLYPKFHRKFIANLKLDAISKETIELEMVFPTLVSITNRHEFRYSEFRKEVDRELVKELEVLRALKMIELKSEYEIYTVNGRFTKNYVTKKWAESKGLKVKLIEFGSSRNSFEIYSISPHSMVERQAKMLSMLAHASKAEIQSLGREYFKKRRSFDPVSGVNWRSRIVPNQIPANTYDLTKKRCVFYSSTEREFTGVQDLIREGDFQSQVESLIGLLELLNPEEWQVFLRRHPVGDVSVQIDGEKELWAPVKNFPHLIEIPADSSIDSFAIADGAELLAHFNSSIGPELIFAGYTNVVTLGPTMWVTLDPEGHCPDSANLERFIKTRKKRAIDVDAVLPWGFFWSKIGIEFSCFMWEKKENNWKLIK
jgi:hypothetical protein